MKVFVCGLGKMGEAVAWAMTKLGHQVRGHDSDPNRVTHCLGKGYIKNGTWENLPTIAITEADVVISCLPYFANNEVAQQCIKYGVRYCDLGGNVQVEKLITETAIAFGNKPVFPSLGLAPGLINILAEHEVQEFGKVPEGIDLYVGGLGASDDVCYPMKYTCNWSVDGLINEYLDDCEILKDGEIVKVKGLSKVVGLSSIYFDDGSYYDTTIYDAALTSGGLSHTARLMKALGVKDCAYYTIRQPGHFSMVKFFTETLNYSKDELRRVLESCVVKSASERDMVIMAIRINDGNNYRCYDKTVYGGNSWAEFGDDTPNFSAMQRCTAFTISAVADLMAKGRMDGSKVCDYSHVNSNWLEFLQNLSTLGLQIYDTQFDNGD